MTAPATATRCPDRRPVPGHRDHATLPNHHKPPVYGRWPPRPGAARYSVALRHTGLGSRRPPPPTSLGPAVRPLRRGAHAETRRASVSHGPPPPPPTFLRTTAAAATAATFPWRQSAAAIATSLWPIVHATTLRLYRARLWRIIRFLSVSKNRKKEIANRSPKNAAPADGVVSNAFNLFIFFVSRRVCFLRDDNGRRTIRCYRHVYRRFFFLYVFKKKKKTKIIRLNSATVYCSIS